MRWFLIIGLVASCCSFAGAGEVITGWGGRHVSRSLTVVDKPVTVEKKIVRPKLVEATVEETIWEPKTVERTVQETVWEPKTIKRTVQRPAYEQQTIRYQASQQRAYRTRTVSRPARVRNLLFGATVKSRSGC